MYSHQTAHTVQAPNEEGVYSHQTVHCVQAPQEKELPVFYKASLHCVKILPSSVKPLHIVMLLISPYISVKPLVEAPLENCGAEQLH